MDLTDLTNLTKDDVLAVAGLASRRSTTERILAGAGYFAAGLIVGVGAALLLAPKSGKGLREDLGEGLRRATGREKPPTDGEAAPDASQEAHP
jgi:gas vesicle protein